MHLVDPTAAGPAIDGTAFPGTSAAAFWSSSPYVGLAGFGWVVDFGDGSSYDTGASYALRVRCVR